MTSYSLLWERKCFQEGHLFSERQLSLDNILISYIYGSLSSFLYPSQQGCGNTVSTCPIYPI